MVLTAAIIPVAISAINALLRYRQRVDEVLSLSAVSQGLPFRLPPAPRDAMPHLPAMLAYFESERGNAVLEFQGLRKDFESVEAAQRNGAPFNDQALANCFALYFEACELNPVAVLPPQANAADRRKFASSGPSGDMRLAYYVVESDRLSRNPALTRIVLVTVDTLLEVVGENASVFVSNPRTRGLVEGLLKEFAVDNDFDDESASDIFRELIGATAFAALDNPGVLPNQPALQALYAALNDVRGQLKEKYGPEKARDTLDRLVTRDGFERLVNSTMTQVARDPSFITSNEYARKAISAALLEVEGKFFDLFKEDPAARYRVLEAIVGVGSQYVQSVLKKEVAPGRPFTSAVLAALVTQVGQQGAQHRLFASIAHGEVLGELYAVALTAVATSGDALVTEAHVSDLVRDFVVGFAATLDAIPLDRVVQPTTLNALMAVALRVLAAHPAALAGKDGYAATVATATLNAAATAVGDGIGPEDVEPVLDAALRTAAGNVGMLGLDRAIAAALQAVSMALADATLKSLLLPEARRQVLLQALAAIAANPKVWQGFQQADLVEPVVNAVFQAAVKGRERQLLSDSGMVEAIALTLKAASRRGRALVDGGPQAPAQLKAVLDVALDLTDAALGRTVSGEDVPQLLSRVAAEFLKAPFVVIEANMARIDQLFESVAAALETP